MIINPIRTFNQTIVIERIRALDSDRSNDRWRTSIDHPVPSSSSTRLVPEPIQLNLSPIRVEIDNDRLRKDDGSPDEEFLERCTKDLIGSIKSILSQVPNSQSNEMIDFNRLIESCRAIVFYKSSSSDELYDQLRSELERKVISINSFLRKSLASSDQNHSLDDLMDSKDLIRAIECINPSCLSEWIKRLQTAWKDWFNKLLMIRGVLIHFDRSTLIRSSKLLPIWELGLQLFRKHILESKLNSISISVSVCQQITLHRQFQMTKNPSIDSIRSLIRSIFITSGARGLESIVLRPFLRATKDFYLKEGSRLMVCVKIGQMEIGGPGGYLLHVNKRLKAERGLIKDILEPIREKEPGLRLKVLRSAIEMVERHLILDHLEILLSDKGLMRLLDRYPDIWSVEALKVLHRLVSKLCMDARLKQSLSGWIKRTGSKILRGLKHDDGDDNGSVEDCGDDDDIEAEDLIVARLIEFKDRMDEIVKRCFLGDREMSNAIKEAFQSFINERPNKIPELIVRFIDQKMIESRNNDRLIKRKAKVESEEECFMNRVISLFRLIERKDLFEEFYKVKLSIRLLILRSLALYELIDFERCLVMKLKKECGPGFTSRLETMFKDIQTSIDLSSDFNQIQSPSDSGGTEIELTVSVLTSGIWPNKVTSKASIDKGLIILPKLMTESLDRFEEFYLSNHLGKRLKWLNPLGTITLKWNILKESVKRGTKEEENGEDGYEEAEKNLKKRLKKESSVKNRKEKKRGKKVKVLKSFSNEEEGKELIVNVYQAIVLLVFNGIKDEESVGIDLISQRTGIDKEDLKRVLKSLSAGKLKVLKETSIKTKEDEVGRTGYKINENFDEDFKKLSIEANDNGEGGEEHRCSKMKRTDYLNFKESFESFEPLKHSIINERTSVKKKLIIERKLRIELMITKVLKQSKRLRMDELNSKVFEMIRNFEEYHRGDEQFDRRLIRGMRVIDRVDRSDDKGKSLQERDCGRYESETFGEIESCVESLISKEYLSKVKCEDGEFEVLYLP
ncbi:Cullin family-domain-containing protein [Phakopsora pachyrhizi]|uniref:Cullin family-domain-containing protein n=1 Tax=Phakopsora pachyrhizi TaxID=170000 RepID=A0AAV0B6G7_PHAPC|nr:Cullin family-domain-containing protein [Phakopsora pachyrhizi]